MRKTLSLTMAVLFLSGACHAAPPAEPLRVLFVGNSLTYVGNLPAVFAALAGANGKSVQSYMLVNPGGTLAERVADGSAASALKQCACTVMILQERGGDLFDGFGQRALVQSKQAIATLAKDGRARDAKVILLGTYNSQSISHKLVTMEGAAAQDAGIPYVAVAERFWQLRDAYPSFEWLRKPSGHPGSALTLLDAILIYRQLYGAYPSADAFTVHAPIYGVHTDLEPKLRKADAPPPDSNTPEGISYLPAVIQDLLAVLEKPIRPRLRVGSAIVSDVLA